MHDVWIRRALFALIAVIPILGLLNVFGQRPDVLRASAPEATLELSAPSHLRGGLLWQARFTITAHSELKRATIELESGWMEGMTINTIEPSPIGEGSHDGRLVLELGHVPAGERYVLHMQFQVNPTNVGRRSADVELYDGERRLATLDRTVTVFP